MVAFPDSNLTISVSKFFEKCYRVTRIKDKVEGRDRPSVSSGLLFRPLPHQKEGCSCNSGNQHDGDGDVQQRVVNRFLRDGDRLSDRLSLESDGHGLVGGLQSRGQ